MKFISKQFTNWGREKSTKVLILEHCRIIMSFAAKDFRLIYILKLPFDVVIFSRLLAGKKVYANVARTNHKKIAWAFYISSNMPLHHHHSVTCFVFQWLIFFLLLLPVRSHSEYLNVKTQNRISKRAHRVEIYAYG